MAAENVSVPVMLELILLLVVTFAVGSALIVRRAGRCARERRIIESLETAFQSEDSLWQQ